MCVLYQFRGRRSRGNSARMRFVSAGIEGLYHQLSEPLRFTGEAIRRTMWSRPVHQAQLRNVTCSGDFLIFQSIWWCCRSGLNTRPPPYQGGALPLSYGSFENSEYLIILFLSSVRLPAARPTPMHGRSDRKKREIRPAAA